MSAEEVQLKDLTGHYGQLRTSEYTPIIELNPVYPISVLRDDTQTDGGTITDHAASYELNHGASGEFASIRSASRGRYLPGRSIMAGVGVWATQSSFGGSDRLVKGLFDMQLDGNNQNTKNVNNGAVYEWLSDGPHARVYKSGDIKFDVNLSKRFDKLPQVLLDGTMWQIAMNYYGLGLIVFQRIQTLPDVPRQITKPLAWYKPKGETSMDNTNLQVGALVDGDSSDNWSAHVTGRHYMIDGKFRRRTRYPSSARENFTITSAGGEQYVHSFRRKPSRREVSIDFFNINVSTDQDLRIRVYVGTDLTDQNFGNIDGIPADETGVEVDVAATAFSGGVKIAQDIAYGGNKNNAHGYTQIGIPASVPDEANITVTAYPLTNNDATVNVNSTIQEEY